MTLADLVAQRTASAAALDSGAGADTFLAFHCEMSPLLDNAGGDFGFGLRFAWHIEGGF